MKLNKQQALCVTLLFSVGLMTGCQRIQNASAEQVSAQVGVGVQELAEEGDAALTSLGDSVAEAEEQGRNRFGFADDSPVQPLRRDNQSYSRPAIKKAPVKKIAPPKPPKVASSSSNILKLGFAERVPGDPLHVRLPGVSDPISIERIDPSGSSLGVPWSRGTQMQIPNPKVPGGKIYFKVP